MCHSNFLYPFVSLLSVMMRKKYFFISNQFCIFKKSLKVFSRKKFQYNSIGPIKNRHMQSNKPSHEINEN